jgi:hypothetical protein
MYHQIEIITGGLIFTNLSEINRNRRHARQMDGDVVLGYHENTIQHQTTSDVLLVCHMDGANITPDGEVDFAVPIEFTDKLLNEVLSACLKMRVYICRWGSVKVMYFIFTVWYTMFGQIWLAVVSLLSHVYQSKLKQIRN